MPTFNSIDRIQYSIASILNQTYQNIQVNISVNKSEDGTEEFLEELYKNNPRVTIIRNDKFLSFNDNFTRVLESCIDDYFMWASDDDYWDPNFIEIGMRAMQENVDYFFPKFVTGKVSKIKGEKKSCGIFQFLEGEIPAERMLNFVNLHHLSHKCNIVYSLFKTEFLREQVNKQDISDDGVLGALISFYGRAIVSEETLFYKDFSYDLNIARIAKEILISMNVKHTSEFKLQVETSYRKLSGFFPEYESLIGEIAKSYPRITIKRDFKILKI